MSCEVFSQVHRLCVFASGSLITVTFKLGAGPVRGTVRLGPSHHYLAVRQGTEGELTDGYLGKIIRKGQVAVPSRGGIPLYLGPAS